MTTVTIEQAQADLPQLLAGLSPGQEIQILDHGRTIARLVREAPASPPPRQPGSAIGQFVILSEDEEHLRDFQEYMP